MTVEFGDLRIDWGWARNRYRDRGILFVSPERDRPPLCVAVMTSPGGAFEIDSYAWPDRLRYRFDIVGD